jgi:hypothetical protein
MTKATGCAIVLSVYAGAAWAGVPVRKSGPCPTLTRHAASPQDNWAQFPTKPVPKDSFPVGTIQDPLTPAQSINCIETAGCGPWSPRAIPISSGLLQAG